MAAKKPDLTEFFSYSRPKKRPCQIGFAKEQLSEEEAVQLDAALAHDPGLITAGAVQQWLGQRGHEVSNPAVVAHRKGTCSCGR